mgnify:CR=1 FL=1
MHFVAIFVGALFLASLACTAAAIRAAMRLNETSEPGDYGP